ncbi:hypothetical protein, partial [Mycolicibacter terrae]|uniref:hypothetical protein n=1 Tax=Mycolicibacter terrae TaxID=1788 RepID=UPI001C8B46FD
FWRQHSRCRQNRGFHAQIKQSLREHARHRNQNVTFPPNRRALIALQNQAAVTRFDHWTHRAPGAVSGGKKHS